MPIPPYIDVAWLREQHACPGQVDNFQRTFPEGKATFTVENLTKACDAGLNLNWLSMKLFGTYLKHGAMDRRNVYEFWKLMHKA